MNEKMSYFTSLPILVWSDEAQKQFTRQQTLIGFYLCFKKKVSVEKKRKEKKKKQVKQELGRGGGGRRRQTHMFVSLLATKSRL